VQARKRKFLLAFERVQARKEEVLLAFELVQARTEEVLLAFERVQARTDQRTSLHKQMEARSKVLSVSRREEIYTLGKLRHQKKSFSPQSEFRQDELKSQGCS